MLPKKDHFQEPLKIEAPYELQTNDTEEEATIDKGELYKRFISGVEKGTIIFKKGGHQKEKGRDD